MEESRYRVAGLVHSFLVDWLGRSLLRKWHLGSSNSRCKMGHSPGLSEELREV